MISQGIGSVTNTDVFLDPSVYYRCQRCTACCKWPGDVRIGEEEIEAIARYLELSVEDFIQRYTRLRSDRQGLSLLEKENHECIMLDGNACRIHEAKPIQCKGFPNTWNFKDWRKTCEAIPYPIEEARAKGWV